MIKKVHIKNFKSIKDLEFEPSKINIFIGEPNTGKSNILEAIGLFSLTYDSTKIGAFVRFKHLSNLFYEDNVEKEVHIVIDDREVKISGERRGAKISIYDKKGSLFHADYNDPSVNIGSIDWVRFESEGYLYPSGASLPSGDRMPEIKFYRFKPLRLSDYSWKWNFLKPPNGENLVDLIRTHKSLMELVSNIFEQYGYRLLLKPYQSELEIVKSKRNVLISLPYNLVSDTLQRQVFFMLAIKSNKDSVLLFEEPEAHAFPRHIKTLAETIAMDKTNQFFIATHKPLSSALHNGEGSEGFTQHLRHLHEGLSDTS